jgi:hypothetical protein
MLISAVKIDNFKRIKQVKLTLANITVLIKAISGAKLRSSSGTERRPVTAKLGVRIPRERQQKQ